MREYPVDPSVREIWKLYPIRLSNGSKSSCCRYPTVLVQSMEGGFVTRNCPKCGKPETLSEEDFMALDLWVACPSCRKPMDAGRLAHSNYGYTCRACDISIRLAALLPRYEDL
jgi:hypothetical protein